MNAFSKLRHSFFQINAIFEKQERSKLVFAILVNTLLSLLDILGVGLIGLIAALSVRGIQSATPGSRVSQALEILHLENLGLQTTVSLLGLTAAAAFLLRTGLSAFVTRKLLIFLGKKSARISLEVSGRVVGSNIQETEANSENETLYSITSGAISLTLGVVGSFVTLISDLILVSVLLFLLIVVNPSVAIPTTVVFIVTGMMLNHALHGKAAKLGIERFHLVTKSNTQILDALSLQRNIYTSNLQKNFLKHIFESRILVGKNLAESEFMPYVTKYVIEIVLVVFSFSLAASQFFLQDASHAMATLSIFMAAGMRIAPAVMRMQQASIQMVGSLSNSESTLFLLTSQWSAVKNQATNLNEPPGLNEPSGRLILECHNLGFRYSLHHGFEIKNVDVKLKENSLTAIVGPSGSGKSTLVDLFLGILKPTSGEVKITGISPEIAIENNPNLVGFVPQRTHILAGTVIENVFLTNEKDLDLQRFWEVMKLVGLDDFIKNLPNLHLTVLGEGGMKLSGGQAQRLGIARALVKRPKLVILDEATSALDGQAEEIVSKSIADLKAEGVCVIVIAHRLSTVKEADLVLYMDRGEILAEGKFEKVRELVPDFDNQARVMGL
jgi:ATP-binding cassette subfamily C protein